MNDSAEIERLVLRNEVLQAVLGAGPELIGAFRSLGTCDSREEAVTTLARDLRISEVAANVLLSSTVELLATGYRQARLRAELDANLAHVALLRQPKRPSN
ncbi:MULTISPECIES: hypothetical protein [unclassified Plantibacter]|uniref:hypothetical protein n=1 Tax=unclassified Plantibacter TaxID=2624265 RepID=UPI003D351039